MKVFYTHATQHLSGLLPFEQGKYHSTQFSDGEWYIKLEEDVADKHIWVVAATHAPAENVIELLLLLNALQNAKARIKLVFTYFGYARSASGAQTLGALLQAYTIEKISIIHAHSPLLHTYLDFKNCIPIDLISQTAQGYTSLAAPDEGAFALVQSLCEQQGLESIYLKKIRSEQETVQILEHEGIVKGQKILIVDDIIATGNTIIEASKRLKELGAQEIRVWATHGIFSGNAIAAIEDSNIKKVYVTNTLAQNNKSSKIEMVSIAPLLEQIIMSE